MPKLFTVGGCIRDEILGKSSKDIDFAFVLDDPEVTIETGFATMKKFMEDEGFQIFLCTEEMLTIRAKFPKTHKNSGLVADFVLARKEEGYIPGTRRPLVKPGTLADDLIRRDFTLNALAKDEDGNLIDLFDGVTALSQGILKTPQDPQITLMDDPLRILRALRFSITKGFKIDESIWRAMSNSLILEKLEKTVSAERIREELLKMLKHDTVATIQLLTKVDLEHIPGFMKLVFGRGLWLKPTFEL